MGPHLRIGDNTSALVRLYVTARRCQLGIAKIADLTESSLKTFKENFDRSLIGHKYFKSRLHYALKNFIALNKAKEQRVLSIFLYGASGIGKTEFLDLLLERAYEKYPEQFASITMTEQDKQQLYNFDYSGLSALRDIKRVFNNRLMDYFNEKASKSTIVNLESTGIFWTDSFLYSCLRSFYIL